MKLSVYDELLGSVRVSMSKLSKDYSVIMVWDKNLKSLLEQVTDIVVSCPSPFSAFLPLPLLLFLLVSSLSFPPSPSTCTYTLIIPLVYLF